MCKCALTLVSNSLSPCYATQKLQIHSFRFSPSALLKNKLCIVAFVGQAFVNVQKTQSLHYKLCKSSRTKVEAMCPRALTHVSNSRSVLRNQNISLSPPTLTAAGAVVSLPGCAQGRFHSCCETGLPNASLASLSLFACRQVSLHQGRTLSPILA